MKITVEELDQKVADAAVKVEQFKVDAMQADGQKRELERQATKAAESGDLELYRALKKQATAIEEESFVRAAQLGKLKNPVSEEEVLSAWGGYAGTYNKSLTAHLAELEKKKNAFLDEYEILVKMQGDALAVRDRLAGYLGLEPTEATRKLEMDYIPFQPQIERPPVTDYMAAFYLSQRKGERKQGYLMPDPVTNKVLAVVANRRID